MITLGEKQNGVNILHVVLGPESLFQFNLTGQSVMDITEFISNVQPGEKCMIVVNRCDCEEELLHMLSFHKAKMQAMEMAGQLSEQMKAQQQGQPQAKEDKKKGSGIKCPKCGAPNSAIMIDDQATPCNTCKKIDLGLKTGEIPPIPPLNDLSEIKKIVAERNPEQRKSMFKFDKKEDKPIDPPSKKPPRGKK